MSSDFSTLVSKLKKRLSQQLPGAEAQYRMAPFGRKDRVDVARAEGDFRSSAVLVLLYPKPEPHFVLTLRPSYDGVHSGQVSLPGGRVEAQDKSLQHTALRETEEEVGVHQNRIEIIGQLSVLPIPVSRFEVHPFVGMVKEAPQFIREEKEVARIIETPVRLLTQHSTRQETRMDLMKYRDVRVPYFAIDGEIVWGATAMILSEFSEILDTQAR